MKKILFSILSLCFAVSVFAGAPLAVSTLHGLADSLTLSNATTIKHGTVIEFYYADGTSLQTNTIPPFKWTFRNTNGVTTSGTNTHLLTLTTNTGDFNIFHAYTDNSNYRGGGLHFSGNDLYLSTIGVGTGASSGNLELEASGSHSIRLKVGGTDLWNLDNSGTLQPLSDAAYTLGGPTLRMFSVYTHSLTNSGTEEGTIGGDWTITGTFRPQGPINAFGNIDATGQTVTAAHFVGEGSAITGLSGVNISGIPNSAFDPVTVPPATNYPHAKGTFTVGWALFFDGTFDAFGSPNYTNGPVGAGGSVPNNLVTNMAGVPIVVTNASFFGTNSALVLTNFQNKAVATISTNGVLSMGTNALAPTVQLDPTAGLNVNTGNTNYLGGNSSFGAGAITFLLGTSVAISRTNIAITGSETLLDPGTNTFIEVTSSTFDPFSFGGITRGIDGRLLVLENTSGKQFVLGNQFSGETAANRIRTGPGADLANTNLPGIFVLIYNGSASRWDVISHNN